MGLGGLFHALALRARAVREEAQAQTALKRFSSAEKRYSWRYIARHPCQTVDGIRETLSKTLFGCWFLARVAFGWSSPGREREGLLCLLRALGLVLEAVESGTFRRLHRTTTPLRDIENGVFGELRAS